SVSVWDGFILDPRQLIPTGRETWAGIKVVIEAVLNLKQATTDVMHIVQDTDPQFIMIKTQHTAVRTNDRTTAPNTSIPLPKAFTFEPSIRHAEVQSSQALFVRILTMTDILGQNSGDKSSTRRRTFGHIRLQREEHGAGSKMGDRSPEL
uniref:VASt domain-containing protein n=1 Tax=Angiostrongylus cantonensis TaxID=6313 RepID=A0A0K0DB07_ANGCA